MTERRGVEQRPVAGPRLEQDETSRRNRVERESCRRRIVDHRGADLTEDPAVLGRTRDGGLQALNSFGEGWIVLEGRRSFETHDVGHGARMRVRKNGWVFG